VDDRAANVVAFARFGRDGRPLVAAANLSPVPRAPYRLPMPRPGRWREVLNSDASAYGGSGMGNMGLVTAEETPWGGEGASAEVTLPPLGVVWLSPDD
jgi:1,4-alpha-glucan branching enzyme